eukprot:NODE_5537_length_569_cov_45.046154_g4811_i0.p1 GENE.NODE_5537_length_569_cov_45.046154_g4811_i0~~NODE_5537_length_569_cov_45.046154_g4811_i0.p1  ORF type:complete len:123 (+),score=19.48 NODE_5537_length_569_cov_45.046154_g4811_i0:113-481(+)
MFGNTGTDNQRSPVVSGTMPDLAHRLARLNSIIHTNILISQSTYNSVHTQFGTCIVDYVRADNDEPESRMPVFQLIVCIEPCFGVTRGFSCLPALDFLQSFCFLLLEVTCVIRNCFLPLKEA